MPLRIHYKIKELAEARGFTKERLARAADLGRTTVAQIWDNKTKSAGIEALVKIAKALQVDVKDLYEEVEAES